MNQTHGINRHNCDCSGPDADLQAVVFAAKSRPEIRLKCNRCGNMYPMIGLPRGVDTDALPRAFENLTEVTA